MSSPTFTYAVAPHGHRAGPGHGHGQPRTPPQYAYAPHGARSTPASASPPACTNSNQKQKQHIPANTAPTPAAYDPPPPYSSKRFAPGGTSSTQKHPPSGSGGRWNPFARKHRSPAEGGSVNNPRGLEAEMLDPEDRAW